jgi:translation initiation factor 2 beta subunit (eIF-2beta)/eIF-5
LVLDKLKKSFSSYDSSSEKHDIDDICNKVETGGRKVKSKLEQEKQIQERIEERIEEMIDDYTCGDNSETIEVGVIREYFKISEDTPDYSDHRRDF